MCKCTQCGCGWADWESRPDSLNNQSINQQQQQSSLPLINCQCLHGVASYSCHWLWFVFSPQWLLLTTELPLSAVETADFRRCLKRYSAAFIHHKTDVSFVVFFFLFFNSPAWMWFIVTVRTGEITQDEIFISCFQIEEEMFRPQRAKRNRFGIF